MKWRSRGGWTCPWYILKKKEKHTQSILEDFPIEPDQKSGLVFHNVQDQNYDQILVYELPCKLEPGLNVEIPVVEGPNNELTPEDQACLSKNLRRIRKEKRK